MYQGFSNIRNAVFSLLARSDLATGAENSSSIDRKYLLKAARVRIANRNSFLLHDVYDKFANYFKLTDSWAVMGESTATYIVGLSCIALSYYERDIFYNEKGFFKASGPLNIFKNFLSSAEVNALVEKAIQEDIGPLKRIREEFEEILRGWQENSEQLPTALVKVDERLDRLFWNI